MNSSQRAQTHPSSTAPGMAMQDSAPIMAPVLFHTHSSNRARGKRTSYTSLHSVAEVSEPRDELESPVLGRHNWPRQSLRRSSIPEHSQYPQPHPQPPLPSAPVIKRKPVSTDLSAAALPALAATRPDMPTPDHSGSTLSGLATSSPSRHNSSDSRLSDAASPVSPQTSGPLNPFSNSYSYVEDFGPEYAANGYSYNNTNTNTNHPSTGHGYGYGYDNYPAATNGYVDVEDGLYGGHRSLDAYATAEAALPPRRKNSKTEWPLRSVMGSVRRVKSPMWDRVYDD
jgi:hypothetical protein